MITKNRFEQIYKEVEDAVIELFDFAQQQNDNYILFLAEGEFRPEYSASRFSPYVISDRIDHYKEASRLHFFEHFLNTNYSFGNAKQTKDNSSKLIVELMIYCHVWESTKFLKQLYRMKELVWDRSYPWEINEVPESTKHNFIRLEIRDNFQKKGLKVADIMKKGFHPSLRNSFLHGEFEIDNSTFDITLHTYRIPRNLKLYELNSISANAWSEYFLFTVCFNYLFIIEKEKRKMSVDKDFEKSEFLIIHPKKRSTTATRYSFGVRKMYYDVSRNSFSFYKSETPHVKKKAPGKKKPLKISPPKLLVSRREMRQYENYIIHAVTELFDKMEKTSPVQFAAFLYDITKTGGGAPVAPASPPEAGRINFSGHFLFGTYINRILKISDSIRTQLEMLIYCHIWESKIFLKQLLTGIQIIEHGTVSWNYEFPDDRRVFIDDLIARYKAQKLELGQIIEFAFHTSLRNAFAHSDFTIEKDTIWLDTYKSDRSWDIDSITIKDWTSRFIISTLLDHIFFLIKERMRNAQPHGALGTTIRNL